MDIVAAQSVSDSTYSQWYVDIRVLKHQADRYARPATPSRLHWPSLRMRQPALSSGLATPCGPPRTGHILFCTSDATT